VSYRVIVKSAQAASVQTAREESHLAGYVKRLASAVKEADHTLDENAYQNAKRLFLASVSNPNPLNYLKTLTSEYGKAEILRCVDRAGRFL
jgi:hypothetical protein